MGLGNYIVFFFFKPQVGIIVLMRRLISRKEIRYCCFCCPLSSFHRKHHAGVFDVSDENLASEKF